MCSAVPEVASLEEERERRYKLPTASKYLLSTLLCAGASLVAKGLTLASVNPGLAEKMAFLLEGGWEGVVPKRAHVCEAWEGGSFSHLTKSMRELVLSR